MLHYPHVQAKAQAEIDSVIGTERLPTIADKAGCGRPAGLPQGFPVGYPGIPRPVFFSSFPENGGAEHRILTQLNKDLATLVTGLLEAQHFK